MCIGVYSISHPKYALILAANRDEFLSRPTEKAKFHSFQRPGEGSTPAEGKETDQILSGRDLQAGGTWLGVNKTTGRVVFLTNITEPHAAYKLSRGYLVSSFLLPDREVPQAEEEINTLINSNNTFAGFNLILFSPTSSEKLSYDAALVTNGGGGNPIYSRPLTSEERVCGALSNGIDHEGGNEWPKVKNGVSGLSQIFEENIQDEETLIERLFGIMSEAKPIGARVELRQTLRVDPFVVSLGDAKAGSLDQGGPTDTYGTRLSTVVLVERDGNAVFIERDIWTWNDEIKQPVLADTSSQRVYRYKLPNKSQ